MYPVDRSEMSAARAQMMARRRRSLGILVGGTVLSGMLALRHRRPAVAARRAVRCSGCAGYVYFLRSQALHDRDRRERSAAARRRPPCGTATTRPTELAPLRGAAEFGRAHRRRRPRAAHHGHDRPHRPVLRRRLGDRFPGRFGGWRRRVRPASRVLVTGARRPSNRRARRPTARSLDHRTQNRPLAVPYAVPAPSVFVVATVTHLGAGATPVATKWRESRAVDVGC